MISIIRWFFLILIVVSSVAGFATDEFVEGFSEPELSTTWQVSATQRLRWRIEPAGFLLLEFDAQDGLHESDLHFSILRPVDKGDWTVETRLELATTGAGYETGIVIYTNQDIMHRWGIRCEDGEREPEYFSEFMNFSEFKKGRRSSYEINEPDLVLRIEKIGTKLALQYWDELEQDFRTYEWTSYRFPVAKVGLFFTSHGRQNAAVRYDYIKLVR